MRESTPLISLRPSSSPGKMLFTMETGYLSITQLNNRIGAISTEAALMAGFSFTGLNAVFASKTTIESDPAREEVIIAFAIMAVMATVLNTTSLIMVNWIGQVVMASEVHPDDYKNLYLLASSLRTEFVFSFTTHILGMLCFLLSAVFVVRLNLGLEPAIFTGGVVGLTIITVIGAALDAYLRFSKTIISPVTRHV